MQVRHLVFTVVLFGALVRGGAAAAEGVVPGAEWDRASAAEAGLSEAGLAQARAFSNEIRSSSVFIVRHGKVVAEWGNTTKRTELASIRKSLLSALIGIAVAERQIDLDSTMGQLGIDDNPPALTDAEKSATVRQLLQARSGVYHLALYESLSAAQARPPRGSHAPGTFWYYNNWDFNVLGTIYERATGAGVFDALDQKIAKPIGMQDYRPRDGSYFRGDASIHPAYPIRMSARDLARFALLYLHGGNWAGRQIVPREWVRESTQSSSHSGYGPGYGYLWWTGFLGDAIAPSVTLPEGSFSAQGSGGQFALVVPALDLVVVHTIDRDIDTPEPWARSMGRLFWLILKSAGYDAGPDVSLAAAVGDRPKGEDLTARLAGTTLSFGAKSKEGPWTLRFEPDGRLTYLQWNRLMGPPVGTWTVEGEQLCLLRTVSRCYIPVWADQRVSLFDHRGVMQIDAVALPQ